MDFRRKPDYADTAYREAVGRLRILLAESYTPVRGRIYTGRNFRELDSAGEETDNQSMLSGNSRNSRLAKPYHSYGYNQVTPRKYYYPVVRSNVGTLQNEQLEKKEPNKIERNSSAPPELMSFIERQEDYIEQLEKESRFCKEELSSLLSKVKEVISENEYLHEKQKSKLIKSVVDHLETETETETEIELAGKSILKSPKKTRIIEGPSIVFESRISELEAQLTQARIDLKKAQEENEAQRKKLSEGSFLDGTNYEKFKKQLDTCNREKEELMDKIKTLQQSLSKLKEKENDTCDQVKRSLDVAEQAQYEKNSAELEIRRLKDELERQHMKLRDAFVDQSRKISDERSAVERRYTQQIEQLTSEVGIQWETTNKLQLELDKQRRENADLRRECAQKQALIDELKKDMQNKILTLQSDIGVTGAEKSALEQQISALNMANERVERQYKQEITRLQAEIQSLRQRLDRADADLIHSRRENIRLNEQVASLEKEINLSSALCEERLKSSTPRSGDIMALPPPTPKKEDRERELSSMIHDMENKHAATVAELESMIHSQNQLMGKLTSECHALTRKLDDSSRRHKEEIRELQTSLGHLSDRFSQAQYSTSITKDEDHYPTPLKRNVPSSQTSPTPQPLETRGLRRSESRSSLKQKSRPSSRQASQEQLPIAASQLAPVESETNEINPQTYVEAPSVQYTSQQYSADSVQYDANPYPEGEIGPRSSQNTSALKQNIMSSSRQASREKLSNGGSQLAPTAQQSSEVSQLYSQQYEMDKPYDNSHQQYVEDPDQYATDINYTSQQYDPNQQYNADPTQYGTDLNQSYAVDDTQYQYDPNIQYDPNQQYEADPNQVYDPIQQYDPAQQYDTSQYYGEESRIPEEGQKNQAPDQNQTKE